MKQGFTLIELCVVLVILGVITSLVWPEFRGMQRSYAVETAAQEFVAATAYARSQAALGHDRYQVRLDAMPAAMQLFHLIAGEEGVVAEPAAGRWGRRRAFDDSVILETSAPRIDFYPNGSATPAHLSMHAGTSLLTIDLDGTLGYARIKTGT